MPKHSHSVTVSTTTLIGKTEGIYAENNVGLSGICSAAANNGKRGTLYNDYATGRQHRTQIQATHNHTATVSSAGGVNNTFNLIQPFLTVYIWKRTT